jgi:hypothetical protein
MDKNYNIRPLGLQEWQREDINHVFRENRTTMPDPNSSNISIAENEKGELVGFGVLQPIYHAEPIWVREDYRDTSAHKDIVNAMLEPLKLITGLRIYVFAPDSKIAYLATKNGFKELPYMVFERIF